MNGRITCIVVMLLCLNVPASPAQERHGRTGQNGRRNQLEELLEAYEKRISELEKRVGETKEDSAGEKDDELLKLLDEAENLSSRRRRRGQTETIVFKGQERHQSQLNPEISVTGDFFAAFSTADDDIITEPGDFTVGRNRFMMRDVGFHFMAPLDPFTRGKFLLGIPGEGDVSLAEFVDEAYMEWLNLPLGMNLKIGKYFNQFGILNRYHEHGLPQFDRPSALANIFGGGNLGGFGMSGNFLLPHMWADALELDLEIATGGDGFFFDDALDSMYGSAHVKNYYDVTRNTYFELGLSGAHGYSDKDNDLRSTVGGIDLTCKWVPAGRSHYRTIEFRTEAFMTSWETPTDTIERFSFYSYLKNRLGPRRWIGVRYSYSELPREIEKETVWDISPTYDFWQSEFVMLRLQYSYTNRSFAEEDHSFFLHTVWAMGPHKHEAY